MFVVLRFRLDVLVDTSIRSKLMSRQQAYENKDIGVSEDNASLDVAAIVKCVTTERARGGSAASGTDIRADSLAIARNSLCLGM